MTLVAALGAGVFVQVVPQRYTAQAKVLLESGDTKQTLDPQVVANQVEAAMSRDIARQAIRALNLVGNAEFDPIVGEIGSFQRVLILLGLTKNPLAGLPEERIFDAYFDRLLVSAVGESHVLTVEFRSSDPELAAKAANTVAELYVASLSATQGEAANAATALLHGNVEALKTQVVDAEAKLETFRARNGLIGAGGVVTALPRAQQLTDLSNQLAQARATRADLVGRMKILKDMIKEGRAFEVADVANNPAIRRAVESRITLRAQLALEARTLLPGHPRIKDLTLQATDLDLQIKLAAERIARGLEDDVKIASARVESLQTTADGQSSVIGRGNTSDGELRGLEREVKLRRDQLDAAVAAYHEAASRDGTRLSLADARIIARALVPDAASFPKKLPTLAAATVLAFLLSAVAVIGRRLVTPSTDRRPVVQNAPTEVQTPPAADPERLIYPEALPPGAQDATFEPAPAVSASAASATETTEVEPWFEIRAAIAASTEFQGRPIVASTSRAVAIVPGFARDASPGEATEPDHERAQAVAIEPVPLVRDEPAIDAALATYVRDESEPVPTADASLAAAASFWDAAWAQTGKPSAAQKTAPAARDDGSYDFKQLIERLEAGPRHGGRAVLVVETTQRRTERNEATMVESLARALASRDRTLWVDVNGRRVSEDDLGLSDVVAAQAVFLDVIHRFPGTRMHAIGSGRVEADAMIDALEGMAIAFNAMAQAYEWVICRIDAAAGEPVHALVSAVAANMDAVVIVSEADVSEDELVALYGLAEDAGAAQVLIAQGWAPPADGEPSADPEMTLRLSAA